MTINDICEQMQANALKLTKEYVPVLDKVCPVCHVKHWERTSLCMTCERFPDRSAGK